MVIQDKTGSKYEQLLAASLLYLGYELDKETEKNYLHPKRNSKTIIEGTYIQPDLVVRQNKTIKTILYATHWSKTRNSAFKYWRTWEEQAQQKIVLGNKLLTINCIFEALPQNASPQMFLTSDELPVDPARDGNLPIAFRGWYPGITYALVESFDVTIAFPVGYSPVNQVTDYDEGDHDQVTTNVLRRALKQKPKNYLGSQWQILQEIRKKALSQIDSQSLPAIRSRYRIGILHVYLFYRLISKVLKGSITLDDFVRSLAENSNDEIKLEKLAKTTAFRAMSEKEIIRIFQLLSSIYVRTGKKPVMFCSMRTMTHGNKSIYRVAFNQDLALCLKDLCVHLEEDGFIASMENAFQRFDQFYGVEEAIGDLADEETVYQKEKFVRETFASLLGNPKKLGQELYKYANVENKKREAVSPDRQNWVFEMLIYLTGLNTAEDLYTRITPEFEKSGHRLRPHAPYGGDTMLIAHLLQGKEVCVDWSPRNKNRTLEEREFKSLSWGAIAQCITEAFKDRAQKIRDTEEVIQRYQENKSRRIISSELNAFEILVEHYLQDICSFVFIKGTNKDILANRIRRSWQTEIIKEVWRASSLETWCEGVSNNEQWLIKMQSAPSNPGDKTKELAGRCRAIRLSWTHGPEICNRTQWNFTQREMPKLALILDGDWNPTKQQNLYEAGWDWVGDVSKLQHLRRLILES